MGFCFISSRCPQDSLSSVFISLCWPHNSFFSILRPHIVGAFFSIFPINGANTPPMKHLDLYRFLLLFIRMDPYSSVSLKNTTVSRNTSCLQWQLHVFRLFTLRRSAGSQKDVGAICQLFWEKGVNMLGRFLPNIRLVPQHSSLIIYTCVSRHSSDQSWKTEGQITGTDDEKKEIEEDSRKKENGQQTDVALSLLFR